MKDQLSKAKAELEEIRKSLAEMEGKYKLTQTLANNTMLSALNTKKSLRVDVVRLRDEVT